jgi:hypothetical protein
MFKIPNIPFASSSPKIKRLNKIKITNNPTIAKN